MAEAEVQMLPAPLTGYAEVTAAFQIVRQVRKANLKWQREVFNTVLYGDTQLERPAPRSGFVGENEVLMKNVYYLATKTQNVSDVLIYTLVHSAVLTEDESILILQQPTNKLRALKLFALLVEKEDPDNSIASSVVKVLSANENQEITTIFAEKFNIVPDVDDDEDPLVDEVGEVLEPGGDVGDDLQDEDNANVPADVPAPGENEEGLENGQWACRFCTFINDAGQIICEVCSKTVDFNLDDSLEVNICPQCTLMNENGVPHCDACGFEFMRRRPEVLEEDDDSDGDD